MKKNKILAGLAVGMGALAVQQAHAFELDFAAVGNSQMVFSAAVGGAHPVAASFTYAPSTVVGAGKGFDFQINNTIGGILPTTSPNSAVGDYGLMTGTFSITTITENPVSQSANGTHVETGTVTTSVGAKVILVDKGYNPALPGGLAAAGNLSHELKANLTFDTITLVYSKSGSHLTYLADGVSDNAALNMTGASYTGTQIDLIALATQSASITAGWSWNSKTLKQMTAIGAGNTKVSFDGNIQSNANVPDGGMTLVLLGFALSGVMLVKRQMA